MEFERKKMTASELNEMKIRAVMQRESLPAELESRIRGWWKRYGKSLSTFRAFEDWERVFCQDMRPHREAAIWGAIFTVFENYMLEFPKDDPGQVLGELCSVSTGIDSSASKRMKVLREKWIQEFRRIDMPAVLDDCLDLAEQEGTYDEVYDMFKAELPPEVADELD